jgi:DNA-binding transcriptional regulator YdaS (Cro superfamily)
MTPKASYTTPGDTIMVKQILDVDDVLRLLRREVELAGGQSEWSRRTGVSRVCLNLILNGRRVPGPQILRALKLKKVSTISGDALRLLQQRVRQVGSQREWARQNGIARPIVNRILNGRQPIRGGILKALKLQKVVSYRKLEDDTLISTG